MTGTFAEKLDRWNAEYLALPLIYPCRNEGCPNKTIHPGLECDECWEAYEASLGPEEPIGPPAHICYRHGREGCPECGTVDPPEPWEIRRDRIL